MRNKIVKEILSWVLVIVIALALALFINRFIVFTVEIPSGSMKDTILVGDRVITFRLAYLFSDPKRGDIIVFPFPDDESDDYIKRIVGLPGETIEGIDGIVYINGEPLVEEYAKEKMIGDFGPYVVPTDSYFMIGDNRNDSLDSRNWVNKYVHKSKIKGKAIVKYPNLQLLN